MDFIRVDSSLTNHEDDWTFIGAKGWREDPAGVIYPPVWSSPDFYPPGWDPNAPPNHYAHELAKEDYAFLTSQVLDDTDISVAHKCPYGSVIHGGVIFRAMDTSQFYVLQIEDLARKGQAYELTLWRQDRTGYRRELARGRAPHSVVPERLYHHGPRTREEWYQSSPNWVTVRIQASGAFIRVSMDGQIVFEVRDRTYSAGYVGLIARGAALFRDLTIEGTAGTLAKAWTVHEGELPRFFYPGSPQLEGYNACPAVCRTAEGTIFAVWCHAVKAWDPAHPTCVAMTRSHDNGRTWTAAQKLISRREANCGPISLFSHRDGTLSFMIGIKSQTLVIRSSDGGSTWSEPAEFLIDGKPLPEKPRTTVSFPMTRLSDGTVVLGLYEADTVPGGSLDSNADRLDRCLITRSADDGFTWEEAVYIDENNFDHNECAVAEVGPGQLVAFMRTLIAPHMWTSRSEDGGKTWSPLVQSNVSAECPVLLNHSSGALILGCRGYGTYLHLSFDHGRTWTSRFRISPASAMMDMIELDDGRVLIIMHEGYRVPGYIRGQFFRVTPAGPVAAELS